MILNKIQQMKKLLFLLTISPFLSFGQQTEGKIIYTETIQMEIDLPEEHRQMMGNLPTSQSIAKVLYFNENESLFKNDDSDEDNDGTFETGSDNGDVQIKVVMASPENFLYKNLSDNNSIEQQEFFGKIFLINGELDAFPWKLTTEQKVVLNYPCTKAVFQDSTNNIVAWFTSQIPVSNGPEGFGQLPGMILELDVDEGQQTFVAESVVFETLSEENLAAPKKGKKVTPEEFETITTAKMKEMQAEMGGDGMMIRIRN